MRLAICAASPSNFDLRTKHAREGMRTVSAGDFLQSGTGRVFQSTHRETPGVAYATITVAYFTARNRNRSVVMLIYLVRLRLGGTLLCQCPPMNSPSK